MKRKRGELPMRRLFWLSFILAILVLIALGIISIPAVSYAPDLYVISDPVPLYQTQLILVLDETPPVLTPACPLEVSADGRTFLTTDPVLAEHCQ